MLQHKTKILIVIAVLAIAGLATAAFMRRSSATPDAFAQPAAYTQPGYVQPAPVASSQQAEYVSDGYYSTLQRPVYVREASSLPAPAAVSQTTEYADGPQYSAGPRREPVYRETYHHGRSKTHSVEIVAGTAAVGAVIGGLAGGGKGAGIGAVSGAGAGFAYDRLTHNH